MLKNIYLILSVLMLISCSSPRSRKIASIAPKADSNIIELESPITDGTDPYFKAANPKAHTVYDEHSSAEAHHKSATKQLIRHLAGPYRFYPVKKNETLKSIAKRIYGDPKKSALIHSWNYEILRTEDDIKPGMKIKYLPRNRMPASK